MSDETPFQIETRVNEITDAASAEAIIELMNKVHWLNDRAREIKHRLDEQLIAWIDANGAIEIGDIRYYVGTKKTDKCVNVTTTIAALMGAVGGDFDEFSAALCAQPIKVGAAKKLLGDKFGELFQTIIEKDLKTGKPVRTVHRTDTRFITSNPVNVTEGSES